MLCQFCWQNAEDDFHHQCLVQHTRDPNAFERGEATIIKYMKYYSLQVAKVFVACARGDTVRLDTLYEIPSPMHPYCNFFLNSY